MQIQVYKKYSKIKAEIEETRQHLFEIDWLEGAGCDCQLDRYKCAGAGVSVPSINEQEVWEFFWRSVSACKRSHPA
jgi:hypothetical protein